MPIDGSTSLKQKKLVTIRQKLWIEIVKYDVPILMSVIFFYRIYEINSGKDDPKKMGLALNILNLFGVANFLWPFVGSILPYGHIRVVAADSKHYHYPSISHLVFGSYARNRFAVALT